MDTLTIKLLHERRSSNVRRKVQGYSGTIYAFQWSLEHKAYVHVTSKQSEIDDIFKAQGRNMGSYFAPVLTLQPAAITVQSPAPADAPVTGSPTTAAFVAQVDMSSAATGKVIVAKPKTKSAA